MFCSVTLYRIFYAVWQSCTVQIFLHSVWYCSGYYLASGFNTSPVLSIMTTQNLLLRFIQYFLDFFCINFSLIQKQAYFSLSLDDSLLGNPAVNSHPGRQRALLSKPGKLLWFSRQHRAGNDVLSGAPPLEWLRAMFVGVVQMHQSHRWME